MSAPEDDRGGSERTVFIPGGGGSIPPAGPPPAAAPPSATPPSATPVFHDPEPPPPPAPPAPPWTPAQPPGGGEPPSTVFAPPGGALPTPPGSTSTGPPAASPVWNDVLPDAAPYVAPPLPESPTADGRIGPGVVLNHIYEVRRFIARGGMGEVYEGVNVNTDERVAIKVILSHLAMDPAVQAMFKKEARTLTRLSHPGLVQYRVLAQEPVLGVLYIVTDFIDGGQLSDHIGQIHPGADELAQLLRRLAAGLAAAHELGAIHRDISPDNVLLPEGRLDQAKIIDFGIAKDLDASSKTIVGDGFAGKLGFVAPEQFGDFDRQIGAWTDVYSLALVLLTVAVGRPVDMGATLVDAIDKRRKGPDLSSVPDSLRPVFEGMLKPNPLDRFRTMKDVLDALDVATGVRSAAPTAFAPAAPPPAKKSSVPLIGAGVGAVVVLGAIAAGVAMMGKKPAPAPPAAGSPAAAVAGDADAETVRGAVEAALPAVSCTWLDVDGAEQGSDGVTVRLSGVAGSPVAAQQAVQTAAAGAGVKVGLIDTANVFPVGQGTCAALDAFRRFRAPSSQTGRMILSRQSNWELMDKNPPCNGPNAKVVVDLKTGGAKDFTVLGFDRKGGLQQIFEDRAALQAVGQSNPELVTDQGGGAYSTTACYNETGLVGEALITGPGPFPVDLPEALKTDQSKVVDAAWIKGFEDKAQAGGWKTSMVWYRVVNDQPG